MSEQAQTTQDIPDTFDKIISDIDTLNDVYIGQAQKLVEVVTPRENVQSIDNPTTDLSEMYSSEKLQGIALSRSGSPYSILCTSSKPDYYRVSYVYNTIGTFAENTPASTDTPDVETFTSKLSNLRTTERSEIRKEILHLMSSSSCELFISRSDSGEILQIEVTKKLFPEYTVAELDRTIQEVLNTGYAVSRTVADAYEMDIEPQEVKNII